MRLTTPFSAVSTAMGVVAGVDLTDRAMIVTGASSGIGVEIARALAAAGAHVTLGRPRSGRRTAHRPRHHHRNRKPPGGRA